MKETAGGTKMRVEKRAANGPTFPTKGRLVQDENQKGEWPAESESPVADLKCSGDGIPRSEIAHKGGVETRFTRLMN